MEEGQSRFMQQVYTALMQNELTPALFSCSEFFPDKIQHITPVTGDGLVLKVNQRVYVLPPSEIGVTGVDDISVYVTRQIILSQLHPVSMLKHPRDTLIASWGDDERGLPSGQVVDAWENRPSALDDTFNHFYDLLVTRDSHPIPKGKLYTLAVNDIVRLYALSRLTSVREPGEVAAHLPDQTSSVGRMG
ncbi:MAG: hypothetical protein ABIA93_04500 [Candidatus Woesearchaeota archaeon]